MQAPLLAPCTAIIRDLPDGNSAVKLVDSATQFDGSEWVCAPTRRTPNRIGTSYVPQHPYIPAPVPSQQTAMANELLTAASAAAIPQSVRDSIQNSIYVPRHPSRPDLWTVRGIRVVGDDTESQGGEGDAETRYSVLLALPVPPAPSQSNVGYAMSVAQTLIGEIGRNVIPLFKPEDVQASEV